jgi:hypothetical protein
LLSKQTNLTYFFQRLSPQITTVPGFFNPLAQGLFPGRPILPPVAPVAPAMRHRSFTDSESSGYMSFTEDSFLDDPPIQQLGSLLVDQSEMIRIMVENREIEESVIDVDA